MKLSPERIAELLAKFPVARATAVENFVGSLDELTFTQALGNLRRDASLYRWDATIVLVIRLAILEHFR